MKKRKNKSYYTKFDYDKFPIEDTRHYGLFYKRNGDNLQVWFDPKRFQESTFYHFKTEMLTVINNRKTHYYYPPKPYRDSYKCNQILDRISEIKGQWNKYYKNLIKDAVKKIKKPKPVSLGDCDLFNCGILEPDEANIWSMHTNWENDYHYHVETHALIASLYAQFIHLFASQIETLTSQLMEFSDYFDRNKLYSLKLPNNIKVENMPSIKPFNKLYAIWNFIKHNSQSTYKKVHDDFPELLIAPDKGFKPGTLAIYYINFSDKLIDDLFYGVSNFLYDLVETKFHENREEATWNYSYFFYDYVRDTIESFTNPLGLPDYL